MEANRDAAAQSLAVAIRAQEEGDLEKSLKFAGKSQELFPTPPAMLLLSQLQSAKAAMPGPSVPTSLHGSETMENQEKPDEPMLQGEEPPVCDFVRGDLVWGKCWGFPTWPAQVRSTKNLADTPPMLRLRFFSDMGENAMLPPKAVTRFDPAHVQPDGKHATSNIKFKSASIKKKYEMAVELALVEAASDDAAARMVDSDIDVEQPEEVWFQEGHDFIGKRVARHFKVKGGMRAMLGTIVSFLPPDGEDEVLFRVEHDDGDMEDLEEYEAIAAFDLYAQQPEGRKLEAAAARAKRDQEKAA